MHHLLPFCFAALLFLLPQATSTYAQGQSAGPKSVNQDAVKQDAVKQDAVKQQVEQIGAAIVAGEFSKVVDSTYPKVVETLGGRQKMLDLLASGLKRLKDSGKSFLSIRAGEPSSFEQGGPDLFTIVPTTIEMKVPEGKMVQRAFTLGISPDGGKTWSFVDGNGFTAEQVKQLFPQFPASLKIPPQEDPVLQKTP